MNEITLVFPHQLFKSNPAVKQGRKIYLIEEYLFFKQYAFHKQKIAFHRASMKFYETHLIKCGHEVEYIDSQNALSDIRLFLKGLSVKKVHYLDPIDDYLGCRIKEGLKKINASSRLYDSPAFVTSQERLTSFFRHEKKKYFQTEFYIQQRKSLGVLLDGAGLPVGGKWSYDSENRKKYPAKKVPPSVSYLSANAYYYEALQYVRDHFSECPGSITSVAYYPTTYDEAEGWLKQFLENRFAEFGTYEDAIVREHGILHHSVLSPLINAGLLTPQYVLNEILAYAASNDIALNNTEGLVRQIIGWREFIRGVYVVKGTEERTRNFWGFKRSIPKTFYTGHTAIDPLDVTIKKVLATGYNHHIERLMVIGNFMLLCEFDPDEVYRWFMELYIDAYDWVMVPNVYGMSQFADGGLMSTKPYISGSNYILKMSNFKKGEWQKTWDALFWRFMHVYRDFFLKNPRLGMLVRTFDKMNPEKQQQHLLIAERYLNGLDNVK